MDKTIVTAFQEFPKTARFARECIITEKIDGTNAQILIEPGDGRSENVIHCWFDDDTRTDMVMRAGSRTRWITPKEDNHGFARWATKHAEELKALGEGRHFGEWWGSGIQRGYGLKNGDKRFSLFNVQRWALHGETPRRIETADPRIEKFQDVLPPCCGVVPVLVTGNFEGISVMAEAAMSMLRDDGSVASPGFMNPEGIVIFHIAGNFGFKRTLVKDEVPKSKGHAK